MTGPAAAPSTQPATATGTATGTATATAATGDVAPPRILAVADSDSYLKWAVWTLARLQQGDPAAGPTPKVSAVLVRSPIVPTPAQVSAAIAGSGVATPRVVGPVELARIVRRTRPDVVLVAATGPVAELIAGQVAHASTRRPALITGIPGMALPATPRGTGWRRWCDAFVVHARVETGPYAAAFSEHDARPELPLARLPFLDAPALPPTTTGSAGEAGDVPTPTNRVLFAAQAKVPSERADRVAVLEGLAGLASEGFEVVVKLRALAGERQTHNEAHPLDELWATERVRLGLPAAAVGFATGPMGDHLTPGTALLTVSSTAALESLARGLPTVFVADFGVSTELLNEQFAESGCLRRFDDVAVTLRAGGPRPDVAWSEQHYLHTAPSELADVVARLTQRARAGTLPHVGRRPYGRRRHLTTVVRSTLPVSVSRVLQR